MGGWNSMRPILAGILASVLFFALAGAASANDVGTGNLQDPDLVALRQAVDDFRTKLATLVDNCALSKKTVWASTTTSCQTSRDKLTLQLKSLDETIVYKTEEIADLRDL